MFSYTTIFTVALVVISELKKKLKIFNSSFSLCHIHCVITMSLTLMPYLSGILPFFSDCYHHPAPSCHHLLTGSFQQPSSWFPCFHPWPPLQSISIQQSKLYFETVKADQVNLLLHSSKHSHSNQSKCLNLCIDI